MAVVRLAAETQNAKLNTQNIESRVLLKIDQCLDRVHFDLREHGVELVGRKAVNRCLSDCAGMACWPTALMISVALPKEGPGSGEAFARELFLACQAAGAVFDCALVGGDTAIWDQRLAITVAAMGEMGEGAEPVLRSGAKAGDTVFVSGALGGSILGRHLTFEPRIRLAQELRKALGDGLHAMMDLSDGLAQDLPRMCAASAVGAKVYAERLPIHPDAEKMSAKDGLPAGLHALGDGEDYELLFVVESQKIPELIRISESGEVRLKAIGEIIDRSGLHLVDGRGGQHSWPQTGWEYES
jgi:thiamine-monophosphate kinase